MPQVAIKTRHRLTTDSVRRHKMILLDLLFLNDASAPKPDSTKIDSEYMYTTSLKSRLRAAGDSVERGPSTVAKNSQKIYNY